MGFDDSDFEKAEKVNSNTQLYKQAGNSIVVNVLERILENLIDKNEHVKILELFGGIGACSKALERLGIDYEIADYVEIDKYAVKSFNAIHNTNFEPQDITQWDKDIDVDLVMHGSPCQDFSLAGLQAGGDEGSGTRSSLMYETIRIVKKLRPKYVIWENVKNLLSKKHRHNFDSYLEIMESLGYANYYQVLNAKDYGIPQNRERVFTISIRKDIYISDEIKPSVRKNFEREKEEISKTNKEIYRCECKSGWQDNKVGIKVSPTIRANNNNTFILEDNIDFEFPSKQELKLKLKDMLEKNVDEKYYLSDKIIDTMLKYNKSYDSTNYDSNDVKRIGGVFDTDKSTHQASSVYDKNGLSPTLDTMQGGYRQPCIEENKVINVGNVNPSGRGQNGQVVDSNGLARTITIEKGEGQKILIKNATKKGYLEAEDGDGIDIGSRMQYHRGNVQKQMIQTITTQGGTERGVVVNTTKEEKWSDLD